MLVPQAGKFEIRENLERLDEVLGKDFCYIVYPGSGIYVMEVPKDFDINIKYGSLARLIERGEF